MYWSHSQHKAMGKRIHQQFLGEEKRIIKHTPSLEALTMVFSPQWYHEAKQPLGTISF